MITKVKFKYPVVHVLWDDAESKVTWQEVPNVPLKPTLATTIGFLIKDEPEHILVADTYAIDSDTGSIEISNTTKIPRGMIKEIHPIKITKIKAKNEAAPQKI